MCLPFRRLRSAAPKMAQLSPSVPQEVKTNSSGAQPRAAATSARHCLTCPAAWRPICILGGGVAPALLHGRGGGLYRLRADGGGGGVIQIVEHGDPSRMGPERAEKCEAPAIVYL